LGAFYPSLSIKTRGICLLVSDLLLGYLYGNKELLNSAKLKAQVERMHADRKV
jgi:hypothetical protein